jgi:hypothetical protein
MRAATARRERYAVASSEWDHNGAHHVVIRDTQSAFRTAKTERAARDVARQSVSRPELVQWTRLDRVYLTENLCMVYVFTVSRLDRSFR